MDFEDFKKAKENAKIALNNLGLRGFILESSALKKYITLLEAWNDKMIEALEAVEASEEELGKPQIN